MSWRSTLTVLGAMIVLPISGMAQVGPDYKFEQKVQGNLSLGSDGMFASSKRTFPLPAGEWTVLLGAQTNTSNRKVQFGNVYMVQNLNGRVASFLLISTNVSTTATEWSDNLCTNKTALYQLKYPSTVWEQRCLEVFGMVNFLDNPQVPLFKILKDGASKLGATVSPVILMANYIQYDRKGNLLRVEYAVDPAAFGVPVEYFPLAESPWSADSLAKEPVRSAFLKQFVAHSEKFSALLEQSFKQTYKADSSGGQNELLPTFEFKP